MDPFSVYLLIFSSLEDYLVQHDRLHFIPKYISKFFSNHTFATPLGKKEDFGECFTLNYSEIMYIKLKSESLTCFSIFC